MTFIDFVFFFLKLTTVRHFTCELNFIHTGENVAGTLKQREKNYVVGL